MSITGDDGNQAVVMHYVDSVKASRHLLKDVRLCGRIMLACTCGTDTTRAGRMYVCRLSNSLSDGTRPCASSQQQRANTLDRILGRGAQQAVADNSAEGTVTLTPSRSPLTLGYEMRIIPSIKLFVLKYYRTCFTAQLTESIQRPTPNKYSS